MSDRIDAIIFGATGFTGLHAVAELHRQSKSRPGFKWGIAGRSEEKLKKVITDLEEKTGDDLSSVALIIADISDEKSIVEMTGKAKLIINTVGPFRFYGEQVFKACLQTGTHQVDVTGEPQFMEEMQLKYDKEAQEKGVYLVSACGFDSVPCDMGTIFVENKFEGVVNSVEVFISTKVEGDYKGSRINYGTWESAIYGLADAPKLKEIRTKLYPNRLPKFVPRLKRKLLAFKTEAVDGKWCVPFLGSDRSVVARSQRFLFENDKKRPVQMEAYLVVGSMLSVMVLSFFAVIFGLLVKFSFGRKLLLDYPELFSYGLFSKTPPSEESHKNTKFRLLIVAEGWDASEKLAEPTDQYTTPPNKKLIACVKGTDPGYGFTTASLVTSGLIVLDENDKMPGTGGVLPPAAAFAKTNLIKKVCETGSVSFEVLEINTDLNSKL